MDQRSDLACALAVAAYGLTVILATTQVSRGTYFDAIGPRGMPFATGAALVVIGLAVAWRRVRRWSTATSHLVPHEGAEDEPGYPASFLRAAAVAASTVAYALSLPSAGFLLATPVYIALGLKLTRRDDPKLLILIPIIFTILVFVIFSQILSVPLPVGPLGGLLVDLGWIDQIR